VTEIKPVGSSVPLVHWFKLNVSNPNAPTLVAQGDISGAAIGTNVATFNPSIAVDAAGDVIINFTASGPNMYPGGLLRLSTGQRPAQLVQRAHSVSSEHRLLQLGQRRQRTTVGQVFLGNRRSE